MELALAAARSALLLVEALVFGTLIVRVLAGDRLHGLRLAWGALAVFGGLWMLLQSAEIAEANTASTMLFAAFDVLRETWVGHVALMRAGLWLLAAGLSRSAPVLTLLPAAAAMALHAAAGHAMASDDTALKLAVLGHVLAAGAWIGGLPALWFALDQPNAAKTVRWFAWMGLACVLILAVTATVQALALAGGFPGLVGTEYGHLLLVKLLLFAGLIGLALRNQFALHTRPSGLRRSVLIEACLGGLTLIVASVLSGTQPGAHTQVDWPFPWRISLGALADEDLRREALGAIMALAGACALVVVATAIARFRWAPIVAAAALAWFAVPHLDFLVVPAEPTLFWQSPLDATPRTIAAGGVAYAAHCAGCHGASGQGDGPRAASLSIPPADLTAAHLWDHTDGTLFWWISEGMRAPDGAVVMPGFADRLDAPTRWAVIDFLHANNPYGAAEGVASHHH